MQRYVDEMSPQRDRWLLSYADLLTLLLAFFVVMYSVSVVDQKKLHEIASSIEAEMIGAISDEMAGAQKSSRPNISR
ncbi:MAG: flagellar motor protein MotB [Pseudomonadales bacterium]|nr:flagellar motor protein MotB [Pseudomonadales bacterium]